MIEAVEVNKAQETVLSNLMQKYLYEMTRYYDDPMDENGNYAYPYLPSYFTEDGRQAYFLYDGSVMVGFALINRHSFTGEPADNCIAEFTIFPAYRRGGRGADAIAALKRKRAGTWQLKYSTGNATATAFWQAIKNTYHGREQRLNDKERVIHFE